MTHGRREAARATSHTSSLRTVSCRANHGQRRMSTACLRAAQERPLHRCGAPLRTPLCWTWRSRWTRSAGSASGNTGCLSERPDGGGSTARPIWTRMTTSTGAMSFRASGASSHLRRNAPPSDPTAGAPEPAGGRALASHASSARHQPTRHKRWRCLRRTCMSQVVRQTEKRRTGGTWRIRLGGRMAAWRRLTPMCWALVEATASPTSTQLSRAICQIFPKWSSRPMRPVTENKLVVARRT
mmetsp:Transcript_32604/g.80699  ORF Transcript_32604/g.80699 Transcript_32604/m.80699 type:complete len:241 (+) Transcript_32604:286-1008(+)